LFSCFFGSCFAVSVAFVVDVSKLIMACVSSPPFSNRELAGKCPKPSASASAERGKKKEEGVSGRRKAHHTKPSYYLSKR